jgi:NitT/TauT family transport system ATP-binding protein
MQKKILEFKNIYLKYHNSQAEILAVDNISFSLYENEFLSIVGPSGCGKSTVLSLISGLLKPSSGKIYKKIKTGYMLQKDCLLEWRTVLQNVLLGLEIHGDLNNKNKNFAINLLEKYGLGEFLNYYPSQISGGMRQKAALVRTLAINPELLLLDEPFSALDFQTRTLLSEEILKIINLENKTAILVTHDISEAISLSDRILVFSKRPAKINKNLKINFKNLTFAEKRKDPKFNYYFEIIWNEISRIF